MPSAGAMAIPARSRDRITKGIDNECGREEFREMRALRTLKVQVCLVGNRRSLLRVPTVAHLLHCAISV